MRRKVRQVEGERERARGGEGAGGLLEGETATAHGQQHEVGRQI